MTQVTEHLEAHGVPFELIAHQQAYTWIAGARALGIDASDRMSGRRSSGKPNMIKSTHVAILTPPA